MFLPSSLVVIFLDFLLTNVECSVISDKVENSRTIQERKKRETIDKSNSSNWMNSFSNMNQNLLNIQAIIAKDEEMQNNCMTGSENTEKRHLMCAGSILTDRHILTSASCMHEATHIRHNLKAPLVVVIAPLKPNPQVIRVHSYKVHPKHDVFPEVYPYNHLHVRHNVAVIKLACSINSQHLYRVRLPKAPYTEICSSDNCLVAVLRKVGKTSLVIYDTRAKQIPLTSRKRRSIETPVELRNGSNTEILPANIREKWRETSKIQEPLLMFDKREAQEILPLEKLGMVISGMKNNISFSSKEMINQQREVLPTLRGTSMTTNIADQYVFQGDSDQNYRQRLFSVRASDGVQGCPQLGSPVMFGKIQAALISTSCDDRQPGASWKYTDIFLNSEWIAGQTSQNTKIVSSESEKSTVKGCSTCIYNFFIDLTGSNDKTNCSHLNLDSNQFKMCASHNGRKMMNKEISIPKKYETSRNLQLHNPSEQRGFRQYETNDQIKNKGNEIFKKNQKLHEKSSKIDKNLPKNDGKNLATDIPIDYDKDLGRGLEMDFDKDFDEKFKNDFNRDYDSNFRHKFEKDDNLRNMEEPKEKRLSKQNSASQDHERLKQNGYKNPNSSKVVQTMNPEQSNDYNPVSKKFRNLRKVLARIHKSIPDKNIEKVAFMGQRKSLPKKEISNSGQEVEHFREEKMQPIVDRQYAVFIRDREKAANNHLNAYPGFNGYFL